jgi:hypothetical protein
MYCVIQEVGLKKASKGNSKRLEVYTWDWTINGKYIKKYTYRKSSECFDRPIKKAYKISIHESYRENGTVKKRQWHIDTLEHYMLIEYGFELPTYKNDMDKKVQEMGVTEDEMYEIIYKKLDPLIEKITKEYHKTDEYKVILEQRKNIELHNRNEQEFKEKYNSDEYDLCYDIFGELRNKDELERIKRENKESQEYQRKSYENFRNNYSYSSSSYQLNNLSNYNDSEKKLIKEAFNLLSHKHHPDKGGSTETMSIINNLKDKLL